MAKGEAKPYEVEMWLNSNYKGLNQVDIKCGKRSTRFCVDDDTYTKLEEALEYATDDKVEISPSENLKQLVAEYIESTRRCKELEALFEQLDAIINKRK